MPRPSLVPAALLCAALLAGGSAAASDTFPDSLQSQLELPAVPGCVLCHLAASDPVGPATQPFSRALVARGLLAGDDASLASALAQMEQAHVDSDGDGALDLDELSWGGNPNVADVPEGSEQVPPTYGCAAGAPGGSGLSWIEAAALAALGALVFRRRSALPP